MRASNSAFGNQRASSKLSLNNSGSRTSLENHFAFMSFVFSSLLLQMPERWHLTCLGVRCRSGSGSWREGDDSGWWVIAGFVRERLRLLKRGEEKIKKEKRRRGEEEKRRVSQPVSRFEKLIPVLHCSGLDEFRKPPLKKRIKKFINQLQHSAFCRT